MNLRVVNGHGELDYSEILFGVRVNQIENGSCRDFLVIREYRVIALRKEEVLSAIIRFHQDEYGAP